MKIKRGGVASDRADAITHVFFYYKLFIILKIVPKRKINLILCNIYFDSEVIDRDQKTKYS